ncbi:MAG: hypothetical protein HY459_01065 [Parcubacteria group bacterium]|nr:hypothetical protein [Parcubacteria group bacterium]
MRITLPARPLNIQLVLRRAGYHEHRDPETGAVSFIRGLSGRGFYPRLHIYYEEGVLNVHLDHKKPSYPGAHAHNAEYEGLLIDEEATRIEKIIAAETGKEVS